MCFFLRFTLLLNYVGVMFSESMNLFRNDMVGKHLNSHFTLFYLTRLMDLTRKSGRDIKKYHRKAFLPFKITVYLTEMMCHYCPLLLSMLTCPNFIVLACQNILVGRKMWLFCASGDMKSRGDSDNLQYWSLFLYFGIDRTSSEPVEDTDTTGFLAEFVSTFSLFFPPVLCLYDCLLVLSCPLFSIFSLFCADFLLFLLRKQSLTVIC